MPRATHPLPPRGGGLGKGRLCPPRRSEAPKREDSVENERYPYWPLPERPAIKWPNDARVAFWLIPNIEHFRFTGSERTAGSSDPDVYAFAARDYGVRVGIWRMMDIL